MSGQTDTSRSGGRAKVSVIFLGADSRVGLAVSKLLNSSRAIGNPPAQERNPSVPPTLDIEI